MSKSNRIQVASLRCLRNGRWVAFVEASVFLLKGPLFVQSCSNPKLGGLGILCFCHVVDPLLICLLVLNVFGMRGVHSL